MTKRWNVHHGNENLGLKTAKEIREALRKGTLDPFDKVSAEGSNIREDLIEVDEIFKESQEEEDDAGATRVLSPALGSSGRGTHIGQRPGNNGSVAPGSGGSGTHAGQRSGNNGAAAPGSDGRGIHTGPRPVSNNPGPAALGSDGNGTTIGLRPAQNGPVAVGGGGSNSSGQQPGTGNAVQGVAGNGGPSGQRPGTANSGQIVAGSPGNASLSGQRPGAGNLAQGAAGAGANGISSGQRLGSSGMPASGAGGGNQPGQNQGAGNSGPAGGNGMANPGANVRPINAFNSSSTNSVSGTNSEGTSFGTNFGGTNFDGTHSGGTNSGTAIYNSRTGAQPSGNAAPYIPDPNQPRTNPPPNNAGGGLSWRSDQTVDFKDQVDSKSNQKRYYLIDKSKILGPLSGLEIQSLYNRNVLNQKVKVQRIGSTRSIPVAQFISSYSEDRLKELTDDGKLNQKVSSPSSKVLNELSRVANAQKLAQSRKNKTYMTLVLAGLVLGAILFVIFDVARPSFSNRRSDSREDREATEGRRGTSRPKLLQQNKNDDSNTYDEEEEGTRSRKPVKPARVQAPKVPRAPKSEPVAERPTKVKPAKRALQKEAVSAPAAAPKSPRAAPVPTPAPASAPAPKKIVDREGAIAKAMNASGSGIKTIGPLSFSMGALDSCASKCTLLFRDATGATIKAVFFKSAYYDLLKKSSGSVFLTGNARKEGSDVTIFIQDVR